MSRVYSDAMATAMQPGSSTGTKRKRGGRKGQKTQQTKKNMESEIIETDTNILEFEFFETDAYDASVKDANDNEAEDVLDRIFDAAKSGKSQDLSKLIFSQFEEEHFGNLQSTNKETTPEHCGKRKSSPEFTRLQSSKKQCRKTVDFKNVINTLVQGNSDEGTSDTSVKRLNEDLSKSSTDVFDTQPEKALNVKSSAQIMPADNGTKDSVSDVSDKTNTGNSTKDSVSDVNKKPAKWINGSGRDVPEKAKSSNLPMLKIGPIHPNLPILIPVSAPIGFLPKGTQAMNAPVATTTTAPLKLPDNFYQYVSNKPKANTAKTMEGVEIVPEKSIGNKVKSSYSLIPNLKQPPANENPEANEKTKADVNTKANENPKANEKTMANEIPKANENQKANEKQQQQRAVIDFSALTKAVAQTIENRLGVYEESDIKLVLFCNKTPIESFSILKNNPRPQSEKEAKRFKLNKTAFDNLVFSEPNASIKAALRNRSDESSEPVNTHLLKNDGKGKAGSAEKLVGGKVPCSAKVEESKGIKIIYDVSSVATALAEHDAVDRKQEKKNDKENLKKDTVDQQSETQGKTLPEDCAKGLEKNSNKKTDVSKRQAVDLGRTGLKKTLIPIAPKPSTSQKPQMETEYVDDSPFVKFMRIEQGHLLNLDLGKQENPSKLIEHVMTPSLKPANQINVRVVKEDKNESDLEGTTLNSDEPMNNFENSLLINESLEEEGAKDDSLEENGCETAKGKEKTKFPYECELCFRLFQQRRYLSKHLFRIHKIPYNDQVVLGMIEESIPKSSASKEETKKQNVMLFQELLSDKVEELEQAKAEEEAKNNDMDDPASDSDEAFADILLQRASLISKLRDQQGCQYDADSPYQLNGRIGDLQSLARKQKELGETEIEPVFVCEHCGKFYRARKSLKDHFDREHLTASGQEPMYIFIATNSFNCSICFVSFPDPYQLVAHSKEHAIADNVNCVLCGKTYSSVYVLRRHIDSVHQYIRPRPYKCGFCSYAAANKWHLKEHNRKHTGEQPFKCPGCDKTFAHQGTMNRHCKSKHGILPGEPKRLFYPEDVPEAHLSRIREINYTPPDKATDKSKLHVNSGTENSTKYLSLVPVGPVISLKDLKKGGFPDKRRQSPSVDKETAEDSLPQEDETHEEGNTLDGEKNKLEESLPNEVEKTHHETVSDFCNSKSFDIKLEAPDSPNSIGNQEPASTTALINQEIADPEYSPADSLVSKSARTRNQTSRRSDVSLEPSPNPHRTRSKTKAPVPITVKEEPLYYWYD